MSARIDILGLRIFARHGVGADERMLGQNFIIDLSLDVDVAASFTSDNIHDSVNYAEVVTLVQNRFTATSFHLLEAAAHHLIQELLATFARISHVRLTLHKPSAPVEANFTTISVTLDQTRNG